MYDLAPNYLSSLSLAIGLEFRPHKLMRTLWQILSAFFISYVRSCIAIRLRLVSGSEVLPRLR